MIFDKGKKVYKKASLGGGLKRNTRDVFFRERKDKTKIEKIANLKSKDNFYRRLTRPIYTGGRQSADTRTVVVTIEGGFSRRDRQKARALGRDLPAEIFRSYYSDIDKLHTPRYVVDFTAQSMAKFIEEFSEKYENLIIKAVNLAYVYR